jgi:hypothetical protein
MIFTIASATNGVDETIEGDFPESPPNINCQLIGMRIGKTTNHPIRQ